MGTEWKRDRHLRVALCATVVVTAILAAIVWWPVPWVMLALLLVGLVCLLTMLYMWLTSRRIERLLDRERARSDSTEKVRQDNPTQPDPGSGPAR